MKGEERDKFKANLYIYLNEQMKLTLDEAIDVERENLHQDIVGQKEYLKEERNNYMKKCFKETPEQMNERLHKEFDIIRD